MIKNEKQLKTTKKKLKEFLLAIHSLKKNSGTKNDIRIKMQLDALSSDIKVFKKEIKEFEKLKAGQVKTITADSIQGISVLLIKARIARSMSHKQLAESLGLKEQQIQRYERENYSNASLSRIEEVVNALDISIMERVSLA